MWKRGKIEEKQGEYIEGHLPVERIFEIIGLGREKQIQNNNKEKLKSLYKILKITPEDIEKVGQIFVERVKSEEKDKGEVREWKKKMRYIKE